MTPEELKQFDEWIKSVQDGLEERNAPAALRARVKEHHEKLRAHLQQESEREAESLKWLTEGEGQPTFLAFVDKELKRLEGLNIPPEQSTIQPLDDAESWTSDRGSGGNDCAVVGVGRVDGWEVGRSMNG